jgi:hypothetical protein
MSSKAALYEQDFYQWTQEQAALLRKGAWVAQILHADFWPEGEPTP